MTLPTAKPQESVGWRAWLSAAEPASRAQAEEDFRFVQQSLGPCRRNRS